MTRKRSRNDQNATVQSFARRPRLLIILGGVAVIGMALAIRFSTGSREAAAKPPVQQASATANQPAGAAQQPQTQRMPDVVAKVNGGVVTRQELAGECLQQYGKQVLETLMNRYLIALECRKHNIAITEQDIDQEIDRVARRFGLPVEQWLVLLSTERGISADNYRNEIIWPTVAMRRLATERLEVSREEVAREFESRFGPKVQVRLIALDDADLAPKVHAALVAQPDDFARLAGKYSTDVNSASAGGLVQPIRRHAGDPQIEQAAFSLREGKISELLRVGDQYIVLKCEKRIPARPPGKAQMEQAEKLIAENIRDRKLREVGSQLFRQLQKQATVENILNDPAKRRAAPGVAATINGHPISIRDLEQACLARYGRDVLQSTVNRKLLQMELAKRGKQVTQQDVDAEIVRAATAAGIVTRDGRADIARWVKMMTEEQEITEAVYVNDIVWPTVALKKLVEGKVAVTKEDMQKGFEANYGPRVRCRAIIMSNLRRAQEVWDMARRNPTVDNFAELAAEYSIDPGSRALGGVVPPIQRHGGQSALEKEAFSMQKGELSGVIQIGDKFVILLCEEITKPVVVQMAEVQDLLHEDLLEKKYRLVMARHFESILDAARITNYLDPKASHQPKTHADGRRPVTASRPAAQRG